MKNVNHENEKPKFKCSQTMTGVHYIKDNQGNEIEFDTNKMTMADLRELLNGIGNLFQSIASSTWDKKLETYKRITCNQERQYRNANLNADDQN